MYQRFPPKIPQMQQLAVLQPEDLKEINQRKILLYLMSDRWLPPVAVFQYKHLMLSEVQGLKLKIQIF